MKVINTKIQDIKIIEPTVCGDDRGFFFESFNQNEFEKTVGNKVVFSQDNHSKSIKGVLRGLHYQLPPKAQAKLVRVIQGEVFDVAVDIRKSSATFGEWVGVLLTAENKKQLWVPEGFAHGFLTLSDTAEFLYKVTGEYAPDYERSILWSDDVLSIDWHYDGIPVASIKDQNGLPYKEAEMFP